MHSPTETGGRASGPAHVAHLRARRSSHRTVVGGCVGARGRRHRSRPCWQPKPHRAEPCRRFATSPTLGHVPGLRGGRKAAVFRGIALVSRRLRAYFSATVANSILMRLITSRHRRRPREPSRAARCALGGVVWLACVTAAAAPPTGPGVVVQGSPVPPQFGYYKTRWRRWDAVDAMPASRGDAAIPVAPSRSVVPGPQEEDAAQPPGAAASRRPDATAPVPLRREAAKRNPPPEAERPMLLPPADENPEPLPPPAPGGGAAQPAQPDGAWLSPPDSRATTRSLVWLSSEVAAARAGSAVEQAAFTQQLIPALLGSHDPETRKAIIAAAADFDTPAAAAICTGALEDPDPGVRMTACTVCSRRDAAGAVPLLARRSAADPDRGVRLHAIRVLGDTRNPAAITALAVLLDDPDPAIRRPTIDALKRASGRDLGDDAAAWRRFASEPRQSTTRWWTAETMRKLF